MSIFRRMKDNNYIALIFLLTITLLVSGIYCYCHNIIASDEVFSVGFANNTRDFLFITKGVYEEYSENGWLSGEFINEYFSVQPGENFAIMSIHRNVRNDVHPPLYFMLLNFVSSFCVNKTSAVPGHIINILISAIMSLFLYLIGRKIFINRATSVLAPLLWLFSLGGENSIQYIRMYLALCTLCVICVYISICIMENEFKYYLYVFMGVLVTIGTLTHYYFYIFAFFAIVYVSIWHVKEKYYKRLGLYYFFLAIGETISFVLYPYVIKHLLHSDRGEQVKQNLAETDMKYYLDHIWGFVDTFNKELFNGYGLVCITFFIILLILKAITKKENERQLFFDSTSRNIGLLITVTIGYFIVLLKISYSTRWHYISPVFALLYILLVAGILYLVSGFCKGEEFTNILCFLSAVISGVIIISGAVKEGKGFDYKNIYLSEQLKKKDVIYIYDSWSDTLENQGTILLNAEKICFIAMDNVYEQDYETLMEYSDGLKNGICLYFSRQVEDIDNIHEYISGKLNVKESNCIWNNDNYVILMQ